MTSIKFCEQLLDLERSLLNYAYHLRLKNADAKDLVQETFLKVLINRDKFVNNSNFKAWTFTIMRNTFINNYRQIVRQNIYNDQNDESFFINEIQSHGSDDIESAYSVLEITQNIEQLNDKFRVPLKMHINGYKYNEISDALDLKIGTVKSRIFLARKQLMNQLNG